MSAANSLLRYGSAHLRCPSPGVAAAATGAWCHFQRPVWPPPCNSHQRHAAWRLVLPDLRHPARLSSRLPAGMLSSAWASFRLIGRLACPLACTRPFPNSRCPLSWSALQACLPLQSVTCIPSRPPLSPSPCRCGHCKALKSDWKQAAKELKGKAKLGAVDCTQVRVDSVAIR